jgi:tripartite-type tricarboxylate transporter receptor subunit TctC
MQYGSAGPGSATHLGCVVLNAAIETDITHVPYRGSGPAMQDLLAGRIDFLCDFVSIAKPQVEASTIKALVLMAQERSPVLPNVPTTAEHGFPKLQAYTWNAVFLPKGTPPEIVRKLHDAIAKTMDTQTVREFFRKLGVSVVTSDRRSPDYLATFVQSEIDKWAKAIRASGVAAQ